ncbi:uncharacterized protein LOC132743211 [Ruditapes philippinarum]|uniref:uncharacterized protein LOC132743211 n=1 Tax=Ruditapes philippinarum TaxID=129788 RepID=UPI00295A6226|nr:uncharacterized protein LOC132743211 [Ruditapes philippinarum]XP_060587725.1 uncharacterized protein LOC132743211 [Ruditapes philippinarum]XP_060587726.1 uncharacterized protein LOC132743211 [Ruditapes philippinarum]XP_060587727.1 uncharacterized protein LOC132743211 [Ruditapes philippinarum]
MHIRWLLLRLRNAIILKKPCDALRHKKPVLISIIIFLCLLLHIVVKTPVEPRSDHREDYINLICSSDRFNLKQAAVQDLKTQNDNSATQQLLSVASKISLRKNRMVLFTVINEAYLPFAYSWLCNTKTMNIHDSVLFVTTDSQSKKKLQKDWPEVNVISMNMDDLRGNQSYSRVGYIKITVKRTEMIQTLLMANIDVFVFEVDCVWLGNPVTAISFEERHDIIVNPVYGTKDLFASGFILLRKTCRSKIVWQKVTDMMNELGKRIADLHEDDVLENYGSENEQKYLADLILDGYGNVTLKMLPLELYADGQWYNLNDEERAKIRPIIINNNWIIGNQAKIERAKQWNHWFLRGDHTCDMDLVKKIIY